MNPNASLSRPISLPKIFKQRGVKRLHPAARLSTLLTTNMEEFSGAWRLDHCENFEDFLKELDVNIVKRKLAFLVVPTVVFKREEEGLWSIE